MVGWWVGLRRVLKGSMRLSSVLVRLARREEVSLEMLGSGEVGRGGFGLWRMVEWMGVSWLWERGGRMFRGLVS